MPTEPSDSAPASDASAPTCTVPASTAGATPAPRCRVPWAELLKRVFAVDALLCPGCGGTMQLLAFIAEGTAAGRILERLGLDATGPPLARAQAPPEPCDPAPDYDLADPSPAD